VNKTNISATMAGQVALGGKLSVNRLGFGAMRLTGEGVWGPPKERKAALAVLRRAVELDVNFIDTADSYGPSVSEELIAEALFPYPSGLVVATKGGWNRPGPNQWTHDASPSHLRKALEGSLKRLRLDRIDLYQLHMPDPVISFEASVETLAELRSEGKIREIGLSNVTQEHIERARKIVPIVSLRLMNKDFTLILSAAAKEHVSMPATQAAFYVNSEELADDDEKDFSAVLRRMEEVAGFEAAPSHR